MCCSVTPKVKVHFSETVLYAAEVQHPRGGVVHVLGYQNKVQGQGRRAGFWDLFSADGVGNAMILPFPARPGSMSKANVIATSGCRDVLQRVADAIPRPAPPALLPAAKSRRVAVTQPKVQVFRAAGIYTVVLAQNPQDIPAALGRVPRKKRPALNPELFDAYARWYPGWTVALCCFNSRDARLADPLLWWYEPMHPDRLFLPALDCHTGDVPDLTANVLVDHVVAVGSHRLPDRAGYQVRHRHPPPAALTPYIRRAVLGKRYNNLLPNGDFVCDLGRLAGGRCDLERQLPPGARPSSPLVGAPG